MNVNIFGMSEKLKPCPFCGYDGLKLEKKRIRYKGHKAYTASVRCNRCHARGGTVINLTIPYAIDEDVESTAYRSWNRRDSDESGEQEEHTQEEFESGMEQYVDENGSL